MKLHLAEPLETEWHGGSKDPISLLAPSVSSLDIIWILWSQRSSFSAAENSSTTGYRSIGQFELARCPAPTSISLPFVWLGVAMTLKRLRSARLPLWRVVLFFAPFINLMFFSRTLSGCRQGSPVSSDTHELSRLGRMVPNSAMGSAAFSLLFTVPASLFVVVGVSDAIIQRIHMRVLRHIRDRVEAKSTPAQGS